MEVLQNQWNKGSVIPWNVFILCWTSILLKLKVNNLPMKTTVAHHYIRHIQVPLTALCTVWLSYDFKGDIVGVQESALRICTKPNIALGFQCLQFQVQQEAQAEKGLKKAHVFCPLQEHPGMFNPSGRSHSFHGRLSSFVVFSGHCFPEFALAPGMTPAGLQQFLLGRKYQVKSGRKYQFS